MKLLKKILVCLVIASLFLGMIVSYASAQGPTGAPPTQNVSPTFSDVNVEGKIVTQRVGYPDLAKTTFGAFIKALKGDPFVPKMIEALAFYKPVLLEDALIVSGPLYGLGAQLFGSVQIEGGLDVVGMTNLNKTYADDLRTGGLYSFSDLFIDEFGNEQFNTDDTEPLIVEDQHGLKVKQGVTIGGNLDVASIVSSGDLSLVSKAAGTILLGNPFGAPDYILGGAKFFILSAGEKFQLTANGASLVLNPFAGPQKNEARLQITGKLENELGALLEIVDNLKVIGMTFQVQNPFDTDKYLTVNPEGLYTSDGDLYLNKLSGKNVAIGSPKIASNLTVYGHLAATSIGMFYEHLAPNIDFNGEQIKTGYSYCSQYEDLTGCNASPGKNTFVTGISKVLYTWDEDTKTSYNPPIEGCSVGFYNPDQKSGFSVQVRAMCFNPDY